MPPLFRFGLLLLACLGMMNANADDWSVRITPDVIMLEGDEDDELVTEIDLINEEQWPAALKLEAVNWTFDKAGIRVYGPDLQVPHDCRRWWTAGYDDLIIQPGATLTHRIRIRIPDDLEEMECRFALAVIPLSGEENTPRHHIPVYINVEDAEPELEFVKLELVSDAGGRQPMVVIRNVGTAHARVVGKLEGEDAQGQELDLVVRPTEILAGETRAIPLLVSKPVGGKAWWSPPLEIEGELRWEDDDMDIEAVLR